MEGICGYLRKCDQLIFLQVTIFSLNEQLTFSFVDSFSHLKVKSCLKSGVELYRGGGVVALCKVRDQSEIVLVNRSYKSCSAAAASSLNKTQLCISSASKMFYYAAILWLRITFLVVQTRM